MVLKPLSPIVGFEFFAREELLRFCSQKTSAN